MKKYEWMASESAPKGYPMEIISGNFYNAKGTGLYIPSGKQMHDGWGTEVSRHIVGDDKKYLPTSLDVFYFSYTEKAFYGGEFNLPGNTISSLFDKGYYSPTAQDDITYRMIVVGVAPGGFISVWLKGIDKATEVFSGFAEKLTDNAIQEINLPEGLTDGEFVSGVLIDEIGLEGIDRIKREGIPYGSWERYRKRYQWTPVVTGASMPKVMNNFWFFNGERDYYSKSLGNDWHNEPKAVPKSMNFVWKHKSNIPIYLEVEFDEAEIIGVFESLAKKNQFTDRVQYQS